MSKIKVFHVGFIALFLLSLAFAEEDQSFLNQAAKRLVEDIETATFEPVREGWAFDYTLQGGAGLLNTFEYLRSLQTFAALQSNLKTVVFIKGPHRDGQLSLSDPNSFGHYNPLFVRRLKAAVQELLSDEAWVAQTYAAMNEYNLLRSIQQLAQIHEYIGENQEEFEKITNEFQRKLAQGNWPEGGYRELVPESLNQSRYWNWAETNYHFWIRRELDGTRLLWAELFSDITTAYGNVE